MKLLEAVYVGLSHLAQGALVSFFVFCSAGKLKTSNKSTNSRLCRYGSNYVKLISSRILKVTRFVDCGSIGTTTASRYPEASARWPHFRG